HAVADRPGRLGFRSHKRAIDELGVQRKGTARLHLAQRGDCFQTPPSDEESELPEQSLLRWLKRLVAGADRCSKAGVAGGPPPVPRCEQLKAIVQTRHNVGW